MSLGIGAQAMANLVYRHAEPDSGKRILKFLAAANMHMYIARSHQGYSDSGADVLEIIQVLVVEAVGWLLDRNPDLAWQQLLQPGGICLEAPIPTLKSFLEFWGRVTRQKTQAVGNF